MIITKLLAKLSMPKVTHHNYEALVPIFENTPGIPNNLFQICLRGKNESSDYISHSLPNHIVSSIRSLKQNNNDWDYTLYCDKEAETFIRNEYGQTILDYYLRIDPVYGSSRADFLKSLLLYRYGGAYIDLKSSLSKNIKESLMDNDNFLVFFWDNLSNGKHHYAIPGNIPEGEILMGFMVAAKGNAFSRSVIIETLKRIDTYNPYIDGVGFGGVMKVAGPGMFTEVIYNKMKTTDERFRIAKPFSDFGFVLSQSGEYTPGKYQKASKMTDYRKMTRPLIKNTSSIVHAINKLYLKIIS